ncbi:MAG: sigma-70 family RNA polymerase sigma factor [Verrucomicrobiaceae bacterium]|nr:sigma-70 family RNA polymerase sigma factor [Verrucomicrobiaceae bacterium]
MTPFSSSPFHTTRWTRVCAAKADSEDGRRALADLCDAYYEPVVAFLRCELRDTDAAREMSHAFFVEMLGGGTIDHAEQQRGRFRSYLLGAVKHFLFRQRLHASRLKRGGGVEAASLDDEEAREVADAAQPAADHVFDLQWARTLLDRALDAQQAECAAKGKAALHDATKPWLTGECEHGDQLALAAELGMNLNTLKSEISRMKKRYRELVREEVSGTLNAGDSIEEEMTALFAALRRA